MDDVLEFADGTRYDFHQSEVEYTPTSPDPQHSPPIEYITPLWDNDIVKQFQWISQEKEQRLSDTKEFGVEEAKNRARKRNEVEIEQSGQYMVVAAADYQSFEDEAKGEIEARSKGAAGSGPNGTAADEYQRGPSVPAQAAAVPAGPSQPGLGRGAAPPQRALFNDRLGRFEPYAGKPAPSAGNKKDQKAGGNVPPALLQRPGGAARKASDSAGISKQDALANSQAGQGKQRFASESKAQQAASKAGPTAKSPEVSQQQKPEKTKLPPPSNPWAKLPPVEKVPVGSIEPDPAPVSSKPIAAPAPTAAVTPSAILAKPQSSNAAALPAAAAAAPAPTENREEAYKKEMQAIAERARKRREAEEAERQAAIERAKQRAAALEPKIAAPEQAATSQSIGSPAAATKTIQQPPSKDRREESWRRTSVSTAETPVIIQQRTLLQPPRQAAPQPQAQAPLQQRSSEQVTKATVAGKAADTTVKSPPAPAKAPSSAAFAALADFATASWRKPSGTSAPAPVAPASQVPSPARTASEAKDPVVEKHDTAPPRAVNEAKPAVNVELAKQKAGSASKSGFSGSPMSPPAIPRVKMGGRPAPSLSAAAVNALSNEAILLAHAFPQPTILIPGAAKADQLPNSPKDRPPQQLNEFDKVMSKVKAAQDDLKTRQSPAGTSADWRARPKLQMRIPAYVPEIFDVSQSERPPTPRSWNIFKVKLPSKKRAPLQPIPAYRLKAFESPKIPFQGVYATSWMQPRGLKLPRHMMVEEYLNPPPKTGEVPRVKVSKLHLPSADPVDPDASEIAPPVSDTGAIGISPDPSTGHSTWRRVSLSGQESPSVPVEVFITKESLTVTDAPTPGSSVFEDFTTVPFELEDQPTNVTIKVSLPKAATAPSAAQSPEMTRFRTYGPKVADGSALSFRKGISPVAEAVPVSQPTSSAMFTVPSEISDDPLPAMPQALAVDDALDKGLYFQVPQEEPQAVAEAVQQPRYLGLSRSTEALSALRQQQPLTKAPSPTMPAFPSLTAGLGGLPRAHSPRSIASAASPKTAFNVNEKPHIPPHVLEQLKKLNDTVSSVCRLYTHQMIDADCNA